MNAGPIEVRTVDTRRERHAFCAFPYALYRDDPWWVPPLRRDERRRWSPRHNASLVSRWQQCYVARRNGKVVGRVAAIRDAGFASRWESGAGLFGFFECTDDIQVAHALLRTAESRLLEQGARSIIGPVNLTTNDEVGILIDGGAARPMLLTPFNPPYYARLLEQSGYSRLADYLGYRWIRGRPHSRAIDRIMRRDEEITLRSSDPRRFEQEGETLRRLYNAAFAGLWGFVPLEREEFRQRAANFRPFYRPELVIFAQHRGEPIGFAVALPDINELLAGLNGRLLPLAWLRLARGIPRIRSVRCLLLGVLPEYASHGVAVRLAVAVSAAAARSGFEIGEMSLVQERNRAMRHVIEAMGFELSRTWRLYRKPIRE